jgi:hypothetical protein
MSTTRTAMRVWRLSTGEYLALSRGGGCMTGNPNLGADCGSPEPWRLERLRGLKQKYDPDNRFRFFAPIV